MFHIAQGISDGLHALAVVIDVESPLPHRIILHAERQREALCWPERGLDGNPELAHQLITLHGEILDVRGGGPKEPTVDAGIVHDPLGISGAGET
jgi:hypothetical protein